VEQQGALENVAAVQDRGSSTEKKSGKNKSEYSMGIFASAEAIILIHVFFWTGVWLFVPWKAMPMPWEVWSAFVRLWNQGFAVDLWTSFWLNVEALAISSILSVSIIYLSVSPYIGKHIRPYLIAASKFRFMGMVGWSLAFTIMFGGGHYLKIALMVFAMTGFMVTAMTSIVANIPQVRYDHARTLRMGEWRIVYEVVIIGTLAEMTLVVIQNAAIGWTILTMVESLSRSEGGVGVLLLGQNKFFKLDGIAAIQMSILCLALAQDAFLSFIHRYFLFSYFYLGKEK
jgi:NitT/TauT family transport system permease protein